MDLQTIARKTGLPLRVVRYVLDHKLLPGQKKVAQFLKAKGQPRSLTELEAFAVAIAATLFHSGLRREVVEGYIAQLIQLKATLIHGLSNNVFSTIYATKYPA